MAFREIKTAFVTGATGLIGRHLVTELVRAGTHVRVLVRKPGAGRALSSPVEEVVGDIFSPESLAVGARDVDVIFHLAGIGSPSSPAEQHPRIIRTNATGTMNVLVAASNAGAKRVVLSSSASVYGNQNVSRLDESLSPEPASVYASSKLIAEQMCEAATQHQGIETVALRYFNVYGPDDSADNSMLIPSLLLRLTKQVPVSLYGGGNQTRDFVFIDDVIQAAVLAAGAERLEHEIINIGSGQASKVSDVVRILKEGLQSESELVLAPARPDEVAHSVANVDKAKALLGFVPQVSLSEGLDRVVNHCRRSH